MINEQRVGMNQQDAYLIKLGQKQTIHSSKNTVWCG